MKKNNFVLMGLIFTSSLFAQIGLGTVSPTATLHIKSAGDTTSTTTSAFKVENSRENLTGNSMFTILDNGYVGINKSTPTAYLDISPEFGGTINPLRIGVNVQHTPRSSNGFIIFNGECATTFDRGIVYGLKLNFVGHARLSIQYGLYIENESSNYLSNSLGIGVANPTKMLEVNGTIKATDINFTGLLVYDNEASAIAAGILVTGDMYKTAQGELRIKL